MGKGVRKCVGKFGERCGEVCWSVRGGEKR